MLKITIFDFIHFILYAVSKFLITLFLFIFGLTIGNSQSLTKTQIDSIHKTQFNIYSEFYSDIKTSKKKLDSLFKVETSSWPDSLVKANLKLKGIYYQRIFKLDSSEYYLRKVIKFEKERLELSPFNLYNLAVTLKKKRSYKTAIDVLNDAQIIALRTDNLKALGIIQDELSSVYSRLQNYQMALDLKLRAINLIENSKPIDTISLIYAKHNLADLYFKTKEYQKSAELFIQASNEFKRINYMPTYHLANTNLANTYIKLEKFHEADSLIQMSIEWFKEFKNENYINYALETKALLLFKQNKLVASSRIYDSLVNNAYNSSNERFYKILLHYFEVLDLLQDDYKLKQELVKFVNFDQEIENYQFGIYDRSDIYKFLLDHLSQSKETEKFNYAKSKLYSIQDSLVKLGEYNVKKQIESEFKKKLLEKDNQLLEQEYEMLGQTLNQKKHLLAFTIFIIIVLIVAALFYIKYYKNLSESKSDQNNLLILNENSLREKLKAEQDLIEFKDKEIKEYKHKLMSLAIEAQNNIEKLGSYISSDKTDDQVLKEISNQQLNYKYWELLIDKFKRYNLEFIEKLKQHDSELSNRHIDFCILVHLGIENRIIASALNISYETVITNKSRLKKKFKLDKDQDFTKYLEQL